MFSLFAFVVGVFTIIFWYVLQDVTRHQGTTGLTKQNGPDLCLHHIERPQRTCACEALSQLALAYVELNRTILKQILISYLKKELCRGINHYSNGYVDVRLIHFSMGTHVPKILSIKRIPDDDLSIAAAVEYLGSTSSLVRLSLPFVEKYIGLETKIKFEVIVEKVTADLLLTLSSQPYPHIRMSLRNMPRWFIRKKVFTPSNHEVNSKLLSWIVDIAITISIRSKLIQPLYIMNDRVYPFEWGMLQKQEAVYQEDTYLDLTFETLLRSAQKKKMFLVATIEPTPWIHMDLVNLTPIAYFTLEIKRKRSFYPGLILSETNNVDVSEEICFSSVIVRSILPDSAAEDALFLEGDLILSIDQVGVGSAQHAVELLDAAEHSAIVRVQREVSFKWSRSSHSMVPAVEWLSKSDVNDIFPYPQSRCTRNRNFDAVLGTPDEIVASAIANGSQSIRTEELDLGKGIDKSIRIPIPRETMYISFGIWEGSDLVGYGSMLLSSCVGWCQETSGQMVLRLPLGHPDDMRASSLPQYLSPYRNVPGFNVRLTHGEIVMRLQVLHDSGI